MERVRTSQLQQALEIVQELSPEEQELLLARIGPARIQQLDTEISETYDQVVETVGQNSDIATEWSMVMPSDTVGVMSAGSMR